MVFYKGELCYINLLLQENFHKVVYMGYKHQFTHIPYILRAKVTRAGPFPPTTATLGASTVRHCCGYCGCGCSCLWQTSCLQCGKLWWLLSAVHLRCVCVLWLLLLLRLLLRLLSASASAVRLRYLYGARGTPAVCARYPCGAPAVPLLCNCSVVVCSAMLAVHLW